MPKKFALGDVMVEGMGLKMPFGDGLKDAIWRCDRILSGDGLRDAIWKLLVGGWAYRCHMKVIVSCRGMGLKMPSGNVWRRMGL